MTMNKAKARDVVTLRLPRQYAAYLRELADARCVSVSVFAAEILFEHMKTHEEEDAKMLKLLAKYGGTGKKGERK
jgi:hypothetical protein